MLRKLAIGSTAAGFAVLFFGVPAALAQVAPPMGAAQKFGVLGASTVTNTGPSVVRGDVGVSPGSAVTGFPPGVVVGGNIHTTATSLAGPAQLAATSVYNNLAGQPCTVDLTGQDLGTLPPLTPGVQLLFGRCRPDGNPDAQLWNRPQRGVHLQNWIPHSRRRATQWSS